MLNIDIIKNMNTEEMVKLLNGNKCDMCTYNNTNCLKEFCSKGIVEWLNMDSELTQNDILYEFENYCDGISGRCDHDDCNYCKIDYIVKHFNINNGKITKIEK